MKLIKDAIRFPVTTAVGVILLVLFGGLALLRLPIQLTPDVEEPKITVQTIWPGASPEEVEREIVDEQEEQLKSLEGLVKMESESRDSSASVVLTFQVGADLDAALLKVSNRLDQVPVYPDDAEKPVLVTVDSDIGAMAWFILGPSEEDGWDGPMYAKYDFADDFIKPEFERVSGISTSRIYGGREREMQVVVDPAELAARQVTINELAAALERENRNYSGGDFDEGKRRYIVRTTGEYTSPEAIEAIVIAVRNGVPIYLGDVAEARLGYRKPQFRMFYWGDDRIAMSAVKETGANALEVMRDLKARVAELNDGLLAREGLHLTQVYDQTEYIQSAIGLVRSNLFVGGTLAILVLLVFLRSFSSTFVVAVSIPISIIGTFIMMAAFGRTINVISLAGLAFAVGMVVDNAIVVLENIYRHRQMGKGLRIAAHDGAQEVWGAVLASTLTTIAVFLPVIFVKEEAGQLFGDIAVAIACAVGLSLLVSITVIPSLSAKVLHAAEGGGFATLWGGVRRAERLNDGIVNLVDWIDRTVLRRVMVVVVLTAAALGLSRLLMPKTDYLPNGNQNFLMGFLLPAPGQSLDELASYRNIYVEGLEPLRVDADAPGADALPGGGVRDFFFGVGAGFGGFLGVSANDGMRVKELPPVFFPINAKIPGAIAFVQQFSIFSSGMSGGRSIDIDLTGPDLEHLIVLGTEVFQGVMRELPGSQARPIPGLDLGNPEVRVRTHRRRAAELGVSNRDLGYAVSAMVDGVKASDYQFQGEEIDLKIVANAEAAHRTHLIEQLPIATPDGRLVTLGTVADVEVVSGPTQINHRERQRSITIQVSPPDTLALEEAMDTVQAAILQPMQDAGRLGGLYRVSLSGSAEKLRQTFDALKWNFVLALVITYLLMSALFESFLYPLVIMFSVPLAALGGFLGLALVHLWTGQTLDVLTMLGFIILVGTVVNNAILIVHQALHYMKREGMESRPALRESVRVRVRPIFMSVLTSVSGMLPLVLFPGAGSELYRGLGSVVVGGLVVSTVFTLFLVPALFSLALEARSAIAAWVRGAARRARGEAT
ncbi:MAG: efflux RND transporter permease subunit [Acidobacteriota bacterium]|jgi:HAE1 family hydrophobic/amphiphilic exporter-1